MRTRLGYIANVCFIGYERMERRVYSLETLRTDLSAAHKDLGDFISQLDIAVEHEKNPIKNDVTVDICNCDICESFRNKK